MLQKILIVGVVIIVVVLAIWLLSRSNTQTVSMDMYIIRDWETMYLAPNPFNEGNADSEKIWVKDPNNETQVQLERLNWVKDPNDQTESIKVHVMGKLVGPGQYGHLGDFPYEIELTSIEEWKVPQN